MDFLAWLVMVSLVGAVLALTSCVPIAKYLEREWALMRAPTWEPGADSTPPPGTRRDPRVRRMVIRQRILGCEMRCAGIQPRVAISAAWEHDERAFRFARRV